jgi:predicted MFS family arabinose efflux permease
MSTTMTEEAPQGRGWTTLVGPYTAVRGNPTLAWLFGGQVVSALGDWLYITALVVLVYSLTHAATLAAALTAVRLLPYVLGLPFGGLLADRLDRRTVMIVADLGRAACMLGLLAVGSAQTVWLAFPLVFLATALGSLFRPALCAVLPEAAGSEQNLVQANALMSQIDGLSLVLGPALGGVLVLLGAPRLAMALNAISYVVSALTLLRVRLGARSARASSDDETADDWLHETLAGFSVLFGAQRGPLAVVTLAQAALSAFSGASWVLLVVLAEQAWRLGDQGAGFLIAAYGLGGLVGGFVVGLLTRRLEPLESFAVSLATAAGALLLVGVGPAGPLPFALLAVFGVADIVNQVSGTTLIQKATVPALLGRVFGAFEATAVSAGVLGAVVVGPLIALVGPRATAVVLALPSLALTLAAARYVRGRAARPAASADLATATG